MKTMTAITMLMAAVNATASSQQSPEFTVHVYVTFEAGFRAADRRRVVLCFQALGVDWRKAHLARCAHRRLGRREQPVNDISAYRSDKLSYRKERESPGLRAALILNGPANLGVQ